MYHPTDRTAHIAVFVTPGVEHCLEREIAQWIDHERSIRSPIAPRANVLLLRYISLREGRGFWGRCIIKV